MNESNKTKSILIIIGTFLSLLLIVAGIFAAVVGIKQVSCKHVWDDGTVKTEATCTEEGELVFKCELCDKKQSKSIEKTSHTWLYVDAKSATCTEDGHNAYTVCEVCETYKEGYEFKADLAKGHTEEDDAAVAATCTETGLTAGKHCTTCGEVTVPQRVTAALNHTIVQVEAKDATCTETGTTAGQKCSTCGTVYTGCEEIPMKEHTSVAVAGKDPTCTQNGLRPGARCSVCGKTLKSQGLLPALGHKYVDGICTRCGEEETIE